MLPPPMPASLDTVSDKETKKTIQFYEFANEDRANKGKDPTTNDPGDTVSEVAMPAVESVLKVSDYPLPLPRLSVKLYIGLKKMVEWFRLII